MTFIAPRIFLRTCGPRPLLVGLYVLLYLLAGTQVLCAQAGDSSTVAPRLQLGVVGGWMAHEVDFTPDVTIQNPTRSELRTGRTLLR